MRRIAVCAVAVLLSLQSTLAQVTVFAGTWKLDPAQSRIAAAAGFSGLIRAGAPATLHITQPANGSLLVESQINESHTRIYISGAKTTTPSGPNGTIAMTSRWDGRALVSEGSQDSAAGSSIAMKEVFTLSGDGKTLTVEITATGPSGPSTSTLVYTKTESVEPCEKWPTPCKRF